MDVKTKHIAIICNYELLENRLGGMDYFFWAYNKACKEKQIKVDWFFPNLGTHGEYNSFNIIPKSNNLSLEQTFLNVAKTKDVKYTHVITHFVELCTPFFKSLKEIEQAKIIVVDHNPRPLGGYPLLKRFKKRLKGLLYSKYIDVFVAVSNYAQEALIHDFGKHIQKKVEVVFNGLDVSKYKKKVDFSKHNKFIVASHLRKEKGIQDLILAVKDLRGYNFEIDIYGKGYYSDELKKMVEDYSLHNIVNFRGSVSNLYDIYCKYDYLIHPSHGETFCYSVVESLLCNLPVITTRKHGNVLNLVKEGTNGFLFEAKNIKELTYLILDIIQGKKIISGDRKLLEQNQFSIENMVQNHMKLLGYLKQ